MGRHGPVVRVEKMCPECSYTKDIRREYIFEADESLLYYYRCKWCGFHWDEGEVVPNVGGVYEN